MNYCKLKILLLKGAVERWIVVPEDLNLAELHEIIQHLFGWEGCHTYDFLKKNGDILDPRYERIDGKLRIVDPKETPDAFTIGEVLPEKGSQVAYLYDWGDDWRHFITRMADPKEQTLCCCKSIGPDGIEDFGGRWRFSAYLYLVRHGQDETLKADPNFPEDVLEMYDEREFPTSESRTAYLTGPSLETLNERLERSYCAILEARKTQPKEAVRSHRPPRNAQDRQMEFGF